MSQARALLGAILAGQVNDASELLQHLEAALTLEVDPLDYCAHRFGLGEARVMERAAAWAGLAFSARVHHTVIPGTVLMGRLARLASVRTIRTRLFEREVVYAAPSFSQFIMLRRHAEQQPDFTRRFCVVPARALRAELVASSTQRLTREARGQLRRRWPYASACVDLTLGWRIAFVLGLLTLLSVAAAAPVYNEALFVPLVGVMLLVPALLRLVAALLPPRVEEPPAPLPDSDLPIYSVLVPLRDEAGMVARLSDALRAIDYPPEKLDIKFVVEATSYETVTAVISQLEDPRFELIEVPDSAPRTKPKAMDYALPLVRGEYLVVYDAEDIPDPGQLRLAASRFAERAELDCLQAELVIDNAEENLLTALFAGEYAGQFGLMLPLLARLRLPMPLGGTSNHFRVSALRELGGWDAFNVTEDADLGVRLARLRYRSGTIDSRTREEAPAELGSWLRQRTRWTKGWMQTFIVHNRHPIRFLRDIGWRGFLGFQIYVGSLILAAPLHSVFLLTLLGQVLAGRETTELWSVVAWLVIVVGYGGPVALVLAGLVRLRRPELLALQLWLPLYWVLHSVATVRALWELLVRPYFWAKTTHGKTRMRRPPIVGAVAQAE